MTAEMAEICSCVWVRDSRGCETARLCQTHFQEWNLCREKFLRWPKMERWFDTQADAEDCARTYLAQHPGPGYQARARVYELAGRFVTFAHSFSTE